MVIVAIYKDNAGTIAGKTSAIPFEACIKRLKLYFSDIKKVKERIINGEVINIPYITLQKDRRINNKKMIRNERRKRKA